MACPATWRTTPCAKHPDHPHRCALEPLIHARSLLYHRCTCGVWWTTAPRRKGP